MVGRRNLQETAREYCPWLVKANGIFSFTEERIVNSRVHDK